MMSDQFASWEFLNNFICFLNMCGLETKKEKLLDKDLLLFPAEQVDHCEGN